MHQQITDSVIPFERVASCDVSLGLKRYVQFLSFKFETTLFKASLVCAIDRKRGYLFAFMLNVYNA